MAYLPFIIPASLILVAWLMVKFSTKPDPEQKKDLIDPTDITEPFHYDFRGNKSHHLN